MLSRTKTIGICAAIFLTSLVTIWGLYFLSSTEYYFSRPETLANIDLPYLSALYFRYYGWMWLVVAGAFLWGQWLILRKECSLADIALYAAYTLLAIAFWTTFALLAIYLCNQTFVFKFQHLPTEPPTWQGGR